ncbi:MAG: replication protein RepA [Nanoarchaeota archaeon]|nr:replication protein RepA [Nanoarchaeota archaeon]MBU1135037.1 replication protein RepA [Nanoarchaeota archaeon]MBU2520323.1 replication protein RepA [Nanoarchaeota archaeon]
MVEEVDSGFGFDRRRLPAVEKQISEIKSDDLRLRLLGIVVDKKDTTLVMDDGTGKTEIIFNEAVNTEIGKFVRVFGRVVPMESGFEIHGEFMQDMSGLDMDLLKRVRQLEV